MRGACPDDGPAGLAWLEVERPGAQDVLVSETSRRGLRFGLSEGGPWDLPAYRQAWACLRPKAPGVPMPVGMGSLDRRANALELTVSGPTFTVASDTAQPGTVVGWAVVTAGFHAEVDGTLVPPAAPFALHVSARVTIRRDAGLRGYLAVQGGFALPERLGSVGADLPAGLPGLAGRALHRGDRLPLWPVLGGASQGAMVAPALCDGTGGSSGRASAASPLAVRVLPGPHLVRLPLSMRHALTRQIWTVSPQANRVGIRLAGGALAPSGDMLGSLPSEPTVLGTVQLPPDGLPMILGPDRGSLGGYLKVLTVAGGDVFRLAQLRPGTEVRFVPVTRQWAWQDRVRSLSG